MACSATVPRRNCHFGSPNFSASAPKIAKKGPVSGSRILAVCLGFLFLIQPLHQSYAATAPTYECSSPSAADGFAACSGSGPNASIIDADVTSGTIVAMRTNPGKALVAIDVWHACRYIDNPLTGVSSFFVPFKTQAEWTSVVTAFNPGFSEVHCSRPYTQSNVYPISSPSSACTLLNANVATPQVYARFPGGVAQTSGATLGCGQTTMSAGELWNGLDSDGGNYSVSWSPFKTVYGPNVTLKANGDQPNVAVEINQPVILSWSASGQNGGTNITCTPNSWGGTSSPTGSIKTDLTAEGPVSYSITCTDNTYNLASTATVTVNGYPHITATITANPSTINSGKSLTLSWASTNASSCSINSGVVDLSGSSVISPTKTTTYTLTCENPGDSVSQDTTVTVNQPVSVSLNANPTTIDSGANAMLIWVSTNAVSCTIDNGIGNLGLSGSVSVQPTKTTIYTVTCENAGGNASQSTTVTVDQPVFVSLSALPTTVSEGGASVLSWSSTNADSCTIDGGVGTVSTSGSVGVSPNATTTYTLTCTNAGGSASQSTTVTADQLVTVSLSATPSTILAGTTSVLNWSSINATSCTINNGIGVIATSGTMSVTPAATTTYLLTCNNASASASQTAKVTVDQLVTASITADATLIAAGSSATLTWTASNATTCIIGAIGNVSPNGGSVVVTPPVSTNYLLECDNGLTGPGSSVVTSVTISLCVTSANPILDTCSHLELPGPTGSWTIGACSVACGGGITGEPTCAGGNGLCDPASKPIAGDACNTQMCVLPTSSVVTVWAQYYNWGAASGFTPYLYRVWTAGFPEIYDFAPAPAVRYFNWAPGYAAPFELWPVANDSTWDSLSKAAIMAVKAQTPSASGGFGAQSSPHTFAQPGSSVITPVGNMAFPLSCAYRNATSIVDSVTSPFTFNKHANPYGSPGTAISVWYCGVNYGLFNTSFLSFP